MFILVVILVVVVLISLLIGSTYGRKVKEVLNKITWKKLLIIYILLSFALLLVGYFGIMEYNPENARIFISQILFEAGTNILIVSSLTYAIKKDN